MKFAVMSDSHDHIWNLRRAVAQAQALGAEVIIHCGDLVSPFMLEELDPFPGRIHLVLGNNAGDLVLLTRYCLARRDKVQLHGWFAVMDFGGISIACVHDHHLARSLARSGDFRLVCFGHTHHWHVERLGSALLVNPGEILGRKESPGWALVDSEILEVTHVLLDRG